jgi:tetratricopeptide (TPR) repeat protein
MHHELTAALKQHQRGLLQEAALGYEQILARDPGHADALHLLGVVHFQSGRYEQAVELIGRAMALRPAVAVFPCNLAEAYRAMNQLERAVACCRQALELQPDYPEAANHLGLALLAQGNQAEAADAFRRALRLRPAFAMVHNNLGNVARLQGDRQQATVHFRAALGVDPNLAEAHSNVGQLLLEQHDAAAALFHCREAVRLRPQFAEAWNNLGNALRELSRLDEAKDCYAEALRLNPELALTYNNMGQALQEAGELELAQAWYVQAIERDPRSARILTNLASALSEQERYAEAAARYEDALRLDLGCGEALNGLGWVRYEEGRFDEAQALYRAALRHDPSLAAAHCNLGTILDEVNKSQAALECFRAALGADPNHAGAYGHLAAALRSKLATEDEAVIRRLLADPALKEGARCGLCFGLGQVLDARRQYDEAAAHLQQANALALSAYRRRGHAYDPASHTEFVDALLAASTPAFFDRLRGSGIDDAQPIFIVGLPRSGTTLTEQILASHSQVHGAGELRLVRETFDRVPYLDRLDRDTVRRLADDHLQRLREFSANKPQVVDKMPDNYLYLGLIAVMFPRAKIIHCRRDLRDVAVSCWMTNFRHIRWANDSGDIAARFRDYGRVMAHWQQVLPLPVLEVRYEDTVADVEAVARRLVAWCELAWEPACLAFHATDRAVRTASLRQVRQPIYTQSVARWKHYEPALGPLFAQLGLFGGSSGADTVM